MKENSVDIIFMEKLLYLYKYNNNTTNCINRDIFLLGFLSVHPSVNKMLNIELNK